MNSRLGRDGNRGAKNAEGRRGRIGGSNARGDGKGQAAVRRGIDKFNGRPSATYSHHNGNRRPDVVNGRRRGHGRGGFGNGRGGFGNGWNHRRFHHGYHGFRFGFGFGLGYFGYGGFGYNRWCYPYFSSGFYFPFHGWCHYPYAWSYWNYPRYRFASSFATYYASDVWGDAPGYASDPYVDTGAYLDPGVIDEDFDGGGGGAVVAPFGTNDGPTLSPVEVLRGQQFANVSFRGLDRVALLRTANVLIKESKFDQAAEAARQAYLLGPTSEALFAIGMARLGARDWHMASWAIQKGIGGSEKAYLDFAVSLDRGLGGPQTQAGVSALERYLVSEPNDEAANFLLASLYAVTGQDYAAYVILRRLVGANYQRQTTELILDEVRRGLESSRKRKL